MSDVDNTPFLDEHQGVDKPQREATKPLSKKDEATVRRVKKILHKAKKKRAQYDYKWLEYYKFFRGVQWQKDRPSYRHAEVINMVFQTIQSQVPTMTDARPKVEFMPAEPADREFAEVMNQLFKADWERGKWLNDTTEVLYDGHIYGSGFSRLE